ncbi:MAG: hypothetical protein ACXVZ2_07925 [Gaiellaceae bacterium]
MPVGCEGRSFVVMWTAPTATVIVSLCAGHETAPWTLVFALGSNVEPWIHGPSANAPPPPPPIPQLKM